MEEANKELSYCGFNCEFCPIYHASLNKNDEEIKIYLNLKYDDNTKDYYCLGCVNSNSKHLSFCEIKKCAESKGEASCGYCKSFPCSKLDMITEETRKHLEELRDQKNNELDNNQ